MEESHPQPSDESFQREEPSEDGGYPVDGADQQRTGEIPLGYSPQLGHYESPTFDPPTISIDDSIKTPRIVVSLPPSPPDFQQIREESEREGYELEEEETAEDRQHSNQDPLPTIIERPPDASHIHRTSLQTIGGENVIPSLSPLVALHPNFAPDSHHPAILQRVSSDPSFSFPPSDASRPSQPPFLQPFHLSPPVQPLADLGGFEMRTISSPSLSSMEGTPQRIHTDPLGSPYSDHPSHPQLISRKPIRTVKKYISGSFPIDRPIERPVQVQDENDNEELERGVLRQKKRKERFRSGIIEEELTDQKIIQAKKDKKKNKNKNKKEEEEEADEEEEEEEEVEEGDNDDDDDDDEDDENEDDDDSTVSEISSDVIEIELDGETISSSSQKEKGNTGRKRKKKKKKAKEAPTSKKRRLAFFGVNVDFSNYFNAVSFRDTLAETNRAVMSRITSAIQLVEGEMTEKIPELFSDPIEWLRYQLSESSHLLFFLAILGIIIGMLAICEDIASGFLFSFRSTLSSALPSWGLQVFMWVAYMQVLVFTAMLGINFISPAAAGSGLPEMKCVLSGAILPQYLSFKTLLSKLFGLALTLGSGLVVGKEGPFCHIGSIVSSNLMKFPLFFDRIQLNQNLKHQMLDAAIAAGVAGSYGCAIGGLLFSIELTSTYYPVRNYWYSAFTAVFASFSYRMAMTLRSSLPLFSATSQVFYSSDVLEAMSGWEILGAIALGVICGIVGPLFVKTHILIVYSRRLFSTTKWFFFEKPYSYAFLVCLITGLVTFPGYLGDFMALSSAGGMKNLFYPGPLSLAGAKDWTDGSIYLNLFYFGLSRFFLCVICISLPLVSGIFTPSVLIGASIGRMYGEMMEFTHPRSPSIPSIYAIVGGGAMASSITQTVSASMIVMEITGQIYTLVPSLIAVLVAMAISRKLTYNIFDGILLARNLPYLPDIHRRG